jgi:endo-1,4-beta-D-glucanase Y
MPGDGGGAYKTHQYRDLFAELGHPPAESRARIEQAFQRLFHGDGQEERLYFETGGNANGPLAYITDWANNDARTEGMSYGMMIAVQMDKKREFDAIWNWANSYMLITDPQNPSVGYFAWSMNTDGSPRATGAAPDGEEYFVMALYFAAHRWGNGSGIYNYQAEADKILRGMRHYSWWRKDTRETALSDRIQQFLYGQGIGTFADRYTLEGKPLSARHSTGMLATTAVASLAAIGGPIAKAFVEELWNTPAPSGEQRYYDGMLYLMSMLHCSGNFRIIEPR